jgi:transcriptional regulator with PAS, ATPase and Fis domain
MSKKKEIAPFLVLAREPRVRRAYERSIGAIRPSLGVPLEALDDVARFVDAAGALLLLDGGDTAATVDASTALAQVPAGQKLILVLDGVEGDALEDALHRLAPHQVLQHPVRGELLRWALAGVAPDTGRGARPQHRPARALLGVSVALRRVAEEIDRVAASRLAVLILGETGTGKELVARALHEKSPRARRSFVTVNCGALPESLLEGELFGHKRGAFTGASRDRRGLMEEADGGTLFLDEVGEMSPILQVKLLRVLETGELRPLGSNDLVEVDLRVISATHRDLEQAIEEGSFRQDLFYRLNGASLYLPPLRRRRVDIPFLAQHFAEEFGENSARRIVLGDDFLDALSQRDFPGNVRELRNAVERAIALAQPGQTLTADDLPPDETGRPAFFAMGTLHDRIAQVEIQAIQEALERFDGNKTRAAEALGISRLGLRKKMQRLRLA